MKRVEKASQPKPFSISKTSNQIDKTSKSSAKKDANKLIIMIEESRDIKPVTARISYRNSIANSSNQPRKSSRPLFTTVNSSQIDDPNSSSTQLLSDYHTSIEIEPFNPDLSCSKDWLNTKMKTTYDTLHEQLSKITQELRNEGYDVGDTSVTSLKQRRTREERRKKNTPNFGIAESDKNELIKSKVEILEDMSVSQQMRNANRHILPQTSKSILGMKAALKSKFGNKMQPNNDKIKPELRKQYTKENNKIIIKPMKSARKSPEPNRHIARKHLFELYSKIIYKVKEIERQKRFNENGKSKLSVRGANSRSDLKCSPFKQSLHKTRKSIQLNFPKIDS